MLAWRNPISLTESRLHASCAGAAVLVHASLALVEMIFQVQLNYLKCNLLIGLNMFWGLANTELYQLASIKHFAVI